MVLFLMTLDMSHSQKSSLQTRPKSGSTLDIFPCLKGCRFGELLCPVTRFVFFLIFFHIFVFIFFHKFFPSPSPLPLSSDPSLLLVFLFLPFIPLFLQFFLFPPLSSFHLLFISPFSHLMALFSVVRDQSRFQKRSTRHKNSQMVWDCVCDHRFLNIIFLIILYLLPHLTYILPHLLTYILPGFLLLLLFYLIFFPLFFFFSLLFFFNSSSFLPSLLNFPSLHPIGYKFPEVIHMIFSLK